MRKLKIQIVTQLKKSNFEISKTEFLTKPKLRQNSKTQIVAKKKSDKTKKSYCNKSQNMKL